MTNLSGSVLAAELALRLQTNTNIYIMYKLFLILVLALGLTAPVYAGNEIVRKVDDFSNLEIVTFKKQLKFERTKGVSIGTAWLTPEAARTQDGTVDSIRLKLIVKCNQTGMITRDPVRASQATGGTLKLKLDESVIELGAINQLSEVDFENSVIQGAYIADYTEQAIFSLSIEQLQAISAASTVKARVTGMNDLYYDLPHKHYKIHQDWLPEMRKFYNAVFNAAPTQTE
ncbi:MAG: hypothetical protein ISR54_10020 [Chlorobium phaeobacteroides]|uniref:Uncharacterized protein n=1 Tax=Chlorobium phaeobacteroides (strain BS1) TaxID=331678 RepID=B3EKK7_CHLPB|nr:hypothetical protein [Chlorobium phaeobacteroides]